MQKDSFWARLKRARMFQVLVVYVGASWAVLQLAELLQDSLALPDWVVPVALLLLLIGLLVILATAWVQALPATRAAVETGVAPGAWEVAPGGILRAIREGELPHLTWGRAILGGAFALWLLFGFAGLYVVVQDRGEAFAPEELVADEAGDGIAIVPFTVRGEGFDVWREGMVDLFATSLDDVGGYRTIDSRTIMARWDESVPEGVDPDLATTLEVARRAGAKYVMTGSAVALGSDVRLAAELVEVESGRGVGAGRVQGPADSVLVLVDRLSIAVMEALLREGGSEILTSHQAASLTTSSLPALKAYLEAEGYYRNADFVPAVEAYERALAADSNFVLAHYRLAEAYGWMEDIESDRAEEHYQAVERLIDGLRPRDRAIVEGNAALTRGELGRIDDVRRTTEKYPDDPEAWFLLGEYLVHLGQPLLAGEEETRRVLRKAVELDPNFGPYYIHLIESEIMAGDTAASRELLDRYAEISRGSFHRDLELANDLFLGDSLAQATARAALDTVGDPTLYRIWGEFNFKVGRPSVQDVVLKEAESRGLPVGILDLNLATAGKLAERRERAERPGNPPSTLMMLDYAEVRFSGKEVNDPDEPDMATCGDVADANIHCLAMVAAWSVESGDPAGARAVSAAIRGAAEETRVAGDTARADARLRAAAMIDAYALSVPDGPMAAIRALEELQGKHGEGMDFWARLWLADLNVAAGRDLQAIPYYEAHRSGVLRPYADFQLGPLYERLGETDRAIASYRSFLQAWEEADPDLAWKGEARAALERLLPVQG